MAPLLHLVVCILLSALCVDAQDASRTIMDDLSEISAMIQHHATRMRVKRKATKDEFFLRLSEGTEDSLNMAKAKAKQQQDVMDDLRAKMMDSVSQANKARSEIEKVTIPCTNSAKA